MASKSDICNLALSHIGISIYIANVDTDTTIEARVCRKWWDAALAFSMRDTDWNFNRRYLDLAPLSGTVPSHWKYKYAYPSDCMFLRAILPPGVRVPRADERIPYEIAGETQENGDIKVIYSDQLTPLVRYSKLVKEPSLFDSIFVVAQSYLLASLIAGPLTVKPQLIASMQNAYQMMASKAEARNYSESEDGPEPESLDFMRNS